MRLLGVAEGSPRRDPPPLSLELPPRKRLPPPAAPEERCASRPPPEGAGAAAGGEAGHFERAAQGGWCHGCRAKLAELKRQALQLAAACNPLAPPACLGWLP
ncbi:UNVERIFIED_CONTAM: hypothetical protein K2H54_023465 [Gekko kuhli]